MKKLFTLLVLFFATITLHAQVRGFGNIDTADLKLTSCDFEKDANAMVLFDKAEVHHKYSTVVMQRHKRIKIFNEKGTDQAKIRIEFYGAHHDEVISEIEARTINLNNNIIEYTPVDKSLIYNQNVDKERNAIVFTFPNVKPGSVIEFMYKWSTPYAGNFPTWFFQSAVPARYSEIQCDFSPDYKFNPIKKVSQKFSTDTSIFINGKNGNGGLRRIWAMTNIHTLKEEPYMPSMIENVQAMWFQISTSSIQNWMNVINNALRDEDLGLQLDSNINISKQEDILAKVNALRTLDEKVAFLFKLVKSTIKWNNFNSIYTDDGIKRSWNKKSGNAAEINLILYHFLKLAGIKVYATLVNEDGKIDESYATTHQLNKVIDYIKVDSTRQYVLDATNEYNVYNETPFYLLNSNGLLIDPKKNISRFITFKNISSKRNVVFINAEIIPDGKMNGTVQLNSFSYNRINAIKRYKEEGEKKYMDYLGDNDNNLKISSLTFENMDVDSLPLTQNITFKLELTGSDDKYIYINPNLFTKLNTNPFLSEERFSDIDFKYPDNYTISGRYKLPVSYKIEALPKSTNLLMPDKSISFKRVVAEQDGYIVILYVIDFKESLYPKQDYPTLRDFYKKMYEMLNEQIILKKS